MRYSIETELRRQAEIEDTLRAFEGGSGRTDVHEVQAAALKACGFEARTAALKIIGNGLREAVERGRQAIISDIAKLNNGDTPS